MLIAVLPFEDQSGNAEQEYIADGLTDEMISELGRFNPDTLGVIARTTAMHYKGVVGKPIRQIADELNVDYIMEGSVRCEADRVRVAVQLIDIRDQTHLWAGRYDRLLGSILALQRDVAADIGREIRVRLPPGRQVNDGKMHTVSPEAYHAHLKGRHS